MPPETEELDRPVLTLGAGPRSVHDARRWVADMLRELGRHDLVETAVLAVSELVTNALLHAVPPYQVAVRGTRGHPRIEVSDGSTDPPEPPRPIDHDDLDKMLSTFGRGLGIVATASLAWGAEIEDAGKVVWFVPARDVGDRMSEVVINGRVPPLALDPDDDTVEVTIQEVPVAELVAFQRHYNELRREVKLLALAHREAYPIASTLADLFVTLESTLRRGTGSGRQRLAAAYAAGADTLDIEVQLPLGGVPELERLIELLDLADEFCRDAQLLALARTPRQRAFQTWFLREVARLANGAPGVPWTDS